MLRYITAESRNRLCRKYLGDLWNTAD